MHASLDDHMSLLKEIAEFLNEETEMETMLQGALKKLLTRSVFASGWIFFIDAKGKHQLIAAENLPPALMDNDCRSMKRGGCWCVSRYHNGELEKASNIIECQRIEQARKQSKLSSESITHHATVPLQSGKEKFGLLNVATPETIEYDQSELALLESIAFQIGSAIKRILLTKQEQEMALVQERNRLARDLHDSVNQLLFSVTLTSRGAMALTEDAEVTEAFQEIHQLTQDALTEMRALIWQLRPKGLESGLVEGIKGYAEMLGIHLVSHVNGVIQLPSRIEEILFRILQEGLNNVRKHAGVNQAELFLTVGPTDILVILKDEGRGFHAGKIPTSLASVGMLSMRERTKSVDGTIEWISSPTEGTEVFIRIPY